MTTAQVKQYLGIQTGTTTYDTDIARYIPIVEAAARQITGGLYLLQVNGTIENASKTMTVSSVYSQTRQLYGAKMSGAGFPYNDPGPKNKTLASVLPAGLQISGDGIPADSFIERVQTFGGESTIILSAAATKTQEVTAYTDFPIGFLTTIAHGVWWMIGQQKTAMGDTSWTSRTVGPVSETRSEAEMKLDGQYGMPAWFVKTFPRVYR
jgi:hypothetical protein